MAVVLYHAEHRHGEPKLVKNALCRLRVGYAAVDEQQLRQFVKPLVAVFISGKATADRLAHAGVIITNVHVLNPELAVITF